MPAHSWIGWSCSSVSCPVRQMLMAPLRPEWMRVVTKKHCLFLVLCRQLPRMKWCRVESLVSHLHDDNMTAHCFGAGGPSWLSSVELTSKTNLAQPQPVPPTPNYVSQPIRWPCSLPCHGSISRFAGSCH